MDETVTQAQPGASAYGRLGDGVEAFLTQRCRRRDDAVVTVKTAAWAFLGWWLRWCEGQRLSATNVGERALAAELEARGLQRVTIRGRRYWQGLEVLGERSTPWT